MSLNPVWDSHERSSSYTPENHDGKSLPSRIFDRGAGGSSFNPLDANPLTNTIENRRSFLIRFATIGATAAFLAASDKASPVAAYPIFPKAEVNTFEIPDPNNFEEVYTFGQKLSQSMQEQSARMGMKLPRHTAEFMSSGDEVFVPDYEWSSACANVDTSALRKTGWAHDFANAFYTRASKLLGDNAGRLIARFSDGEADGLEVAIDRGVLIPKNNDELLLYYMNFYHTDDFNRLVGHEMAHCMNPNFSPAKNMPTYRGLLADWYNYKIHSLIPELINAQHLYPGISFNHGLTAGALGLLNLFTYNYMGNGVAITRPVFVDTQGNLDAKANACFGAMINFIETNQNIDGFTYANTHNAQFENSVLPAATELISRSLDGTLVRQPGLADDFDIIMQEVLPYVATEITADVVANSVFSPQFINNDSRLITASKLLIASFDPNFEVKL